MTSLLFKMTQIRSGAAAHQEGVTANSNVPGLPDAAQVLLSSLRRLLPVLGTLVCKAANLQAVNRQTMNMLES